MEGNESKLKSGRLLVTESRMPKLVTRDNAISSHGKVLVKWRDYQSSDLGGLETTTKIGRLMEQSSSKTKFTCKHATCNRGNLKSVK